VVRIADWGASASRCSILHLPPGPHKSAGKDLSTGLKALWIDLSWANHQPNRHSFDVWMKQAVFRARPAPAGSKACGCGKNCCLSTAWNFHPQRRPCSAQQEMPLAKPVAERLPTAHLGPVPEHPALSPTAALPAPQPKVPASTGPSTAQDDQARKAR